MSARFILIVARADVALAFRAELEALHPGSAGKIAAQKYRRTGDTPGTHSHFVAHGRVSDEVWRGIIAALTIATSGVRDSTNWEGKPATPVGKARWAMALDGVDLVAGFRVSTLDDVEASSPREVLANLNLVATAADDIPPQ